MTPHEMDPRFAAEIARMKKLTIEKNRQYGRWLLAAAVAGLVVGVAAWFGGLGEGELGPSVGAGGIVSGIVFVIWRVSTDTPAPNCPRCSYCWGIAENEDEWLKWKCCPSCGLKVNDDAEAKERP